MNANLEAYSDLLEAYAQLAAWQADHREKFPSHLTEITLVSRGSSESGSMRFTAKIVADLDDGIMNSPPRLFVEAHDRSAREAAEMVIAGARIIIDEDSAEWSKNQRAGTS